jgi:hypothetical protein
MRLATAFELRRLALAGGGAVFDVSTPSRIAGQWDQLGAVFTRLGMPEARVAWPGFDLLSVDGTGAPTRLIELKSSGESARRQEMTWNEWKSAGEQALRSLYFLYLVGNLRSDLAGQLPFIRTVADPFGQLSRTVTINIRSERTVTLAVHRFEKAELEVIPVRGGA